MTKVHIFKGVDAFLDYCNASIRSTTFPEVVSDFAILVFWSVLRYLAGWAGWGAGTEHLMVGGTDT